MSKRLIIIDPLIADWTGHCAEYAVRVLKEAKKMNLEPVLVCSRGFKKLSTNDISIMPAYSYENSVLPKYLRWLHYLKKWKNQYGALFKHCLDCFVAKGAPRNDGLRCLAKQDNIGPSLRARQREAIQHHPVVASAQREAIHSFIKKFFHSLQAKNFARETENALTELKVTEDDIIFIPNAIYCVLLGLLKTLPKFKNLQWHILFHFEFFTLVGENENGTHYKNTAKAIFAELKKFPHQLFFYTDTEQLTKHYEQYGAQFKTLPIPVSSAYTPQTQSTSPLRIHYIGAARSNKGYHLLPNLIKELQDDLHQNKITFAIQSNFNNIEGDALAMAARSELEKIQSHNITLITESMNPEHYQQHVLTSDIVLIPYDANEYVNRSSGIFAECMSAGIPVIVPDNSWMAEQLKNIPTDSVGKIYQNSNELKQCLDEIIHHYQHYRTSAREFAKNWSEFHNPRKLIEILNAK
jgi:hypothetical protein